MTAYDKDGKEVAKDSVEETKEGFLYKLSPHALAVGVPAFIICATLAVGSIVNLIAPPTPPKKHDPVYLIG